ncbi:MAG: hypothetical protein V4730_08500 [Pseudomonadota bacterium]
MTTKFPFKYSECLANRTLARTPEKLKITGQNDPYLLLIVRLLSGAIIFEHKSSSSIIHQKNNYFSSDFKGYSQYWDTRFPALIADDYSAKQFSAFISSTNTNNRSFYKNILSEISYAIYYQEKGSHLSAFTFIYRALEHVSYAFPLIYVSKTNDFSKTYDFLKKLMAGDKNIGELGFLKRFIQTIYSGDSICESSVDFHMALSTEIEQNSIFNTLEKLCAPEMIAASTNKPMVLSIKYLEVGSLLITIRNRFFHFMNGGVKNITSSDIEDIDVLFSLVNKNFLYWLSTIFLAVISHNALDFEKIKYHAK